MNKYVKIFAVLSVLVSSCLFNNVNARERKYDSILYEYNDELVNDDIIDMEENAVEFRTNSYYLNNREDEETGKSITIVYTEEEYLNNSRENSSTYSLGIGNNDSVSNDWMKFTLEVVKKTNSQYTFTLHYDWLTPPNLKFTDVIALGHDSNLTFDTQSIKSYHKHYGYNSNSSSFSYNYNNNFPDNINAKDYFVGIKFKLDTSTLYGMDKYCGYIKVDGRFSNTNTVSGTLSFLYGHTQIGINLGWGLSTAIKKQGECTLNFDPGITVTCDQFQYQDEFVK